jgi:hypothetical protein
LQRIDSRTARKIEKMIRNGWSICLFLSPTEAMSLWTILDTLARRAALRLNAAERHELTTITERLEDALRGKRARMRAMLNGWSVHLHITPGEAATLRELLSAVSNEAPTVMGSRMLRTLRDRLVEEITEPPEPEEPSQRESGNGRGISPFVWRSRRSE